MSDKQETFIRVTNRDVYNKLLEIEKKQRADGDVHQEILEHARLTNGRVTRLENTSVGLWVTKNPIKFSVMLLAFVALVSDFRQPIVELLVSFFI